MAATPDTTTLADGTTPAGLATSGAAPYTDPNADPYARPSRTNPAPTAPRTPLHTPHP
ncbi:hypothetical protein OYE22_13765 [Streptomyces sp. 71268]|uniref:hypothetical protein n=1 Tax=Streptomyces sp. 71268 TaxID=3002640 RepID=UPI0023F70551|nr:hypothetical protein [Streptomyces sp. 71268]WEV26148.1 hypothetical protein OYE22_13765 [Streptomyces sp. 71268]